MFPINMWNVYQAMGPHTNNQPEGWHNRLNKIVGKLHPDLLELICIFQQEEVSTHMTILQLATGGRNHPCKKRCVEKDRRIETMMEEPGKQWWSENHLRTFEQRIFSKSHTTKILKTP